METTQLWRLSPPSQQGVRPTNQDRALMDVARELETTFLSEMLDHAGLGQTPDAFGGGIGEEQYASFLRHSQATEMTANGGIGLAEAIFESLKERVDGR